MIADGLRRLHATGAVLHTTLAYCLLAEGCLLADRPEAALGYLEAAHRHAETYGELYMAAEIHRLHAGALRTRGARAEEGEKYLHAALEVARQQAARLWELRAACDLARLWRDQRRGAEAQELLAPIYAAFVEGFAFPDLAEARALLEELSAAPGGGG
jgi:predicted ATPase